MVGGDVPAPVDLPVRLELSQWIEDSRSRVSTRSEPRPFANGLQNQNARPLQ